MYVPKFLIKLHQRIKNTRVWKYKWRIVAISPFIASLGIFSFYTIYRTQAEEQNRDFIETWEAKGETLDIDTLYPPPGDERSDFLAHPAVQREIQGTHKISLAKIHQLEIKGITETPNHYTSADGKGTYKMGVAPNIRLWLDPPLLTQPYQQAAKKCLQLIAPFDSRLDSIIEASHRPETYHARGFDENANLVHASSSLAALKFAGSGRLLSDRVILQLAANDEVAAAVDMQGLFRLTNHLSSGHSLIGYLVGAAMIQSLEQPLWEGLRTHRWSDSSLQKFETQLAQMNEHQRFLKCMRQEMAYTHLMLQALHNDPEYLKKQYASLFPSSGTSKTKTWEEWAEEIKEKIKPRGWYLKRGIQQLTILDQELFYPEGNRCTKLSIEQANKLETIPDPMHDPYSNSLFAGDETMSLYAQQIGKALQTQASIHNMRTAIALERYRLKRGKYPDNLEALVPTYLPTVLEDVITSKPLSYRIKADGTPLIYSIGYDQTDNGGHPHRRIEKGDWAWMYSSPTGFTYDDYKSR